MRNHFLRAAGKALWTPAQITTALWLDAADAGTVTTVSGAVSRWNDKSGNGRNVSQATSANRPLYLTSQVNGLSALSFDGVNDAMSNTSIGLPIGATARTMFAVYKPQGNTSAANDICAQGIANSTGAWFALEFRGTTGNVGDPYFAGFNADLFDSAAVTTSTKIASINYTGSVGTLKRNGSQIAAGTLSLSTTGNAFKIGEAATAGQNANMLMCEIVFLSSSANTATEQQIEGYLAHKWGLNANLPDGHPYKSAPPT